MGYSELKKFSEEKKDQFYFQGKFFKTLEERFEYEKLWKKKPLDQETCERILGNLIRDIKVNLMMYKEKLTNEDFLKYVEDVLIYSLSHLPW